MKRIINTTVIKRIIFLIVNFLIILYPSVTSAQQKPIYWGINGHPLTQGDYVRKTYDDQIKYLKDLNVDYYRIDVLLHKSGLIRNEPGFSYFHNRLKDAGIKPFYVLMQYDILGDDSVFVYKENYKQGEQFALRHKNLSDVIEIGNEEDLKIIKSGDNDGTKASHYHSEKAQQLMWQLSGFIDGLKSIRPDIKISISLTWTHWYYLDLLQEYKVNYDIIGYHWYSNMGDITNVRQPYGNFLPHIAKKYNKDIWITEFNTFYGTKNTSEQKQHDYVKRNILALLEQGLVKAFFFHELFDQPALRQRYPGEADYGILTKEGSAYKKKMIYHTFKEIIQDNKTRKKQ